MILQIGRGYLNHHLDILKVGRGRFKHHLNILQVGRTRLTQPRERIVAPECHNLSQWLDTTLKTLILLYSHALMKIQQIMRMRISCVAYRGEQMNQISRSNRIAFFGQLSIQFSCFFTCRDDNYIRIVEHAVLSFWDWFRLLTFDSFLDLR